MNTKLCFKNSKHVRFTSSEDVFTKSSKQMINVTPFYGTVYNFAAYRIEIPFEAICKALANLSRAYAYTVFSQELT